MFIYNDSLDNWRISLIVYNIVLTLIDFLDSKNVLSHRNQILRLINHITLKGWDRTLKAHLTVQPASGSFFVYGLDKTFYFIYVNICGCPFCFRIDEAISYTGLCVLTTYTFFFIMWSTNHLQFWENTFSNGFGSFQNNLHEVSIFPRCKKTLIWVNSLIN